MWFDGGEFNDLADFILVGIGDGVTTQFRLPDFNVLSASVIIKVNDVIDPLWTIVEAPGVISFTNAPPDESHITAKYKKRSKCRIFYGDEQALVQTDNLKSFETERVIFREIP
jgi:hypothetical protein